MKKKILIKIAESILNTAANSIDGYCYPSDVLYEGIELERALAQLKFYGTILSYGKGASPIFKINEKGQAFANEGAWSGINNKLQKEEGGMNSLKKSIIKRLPKRFLSSRFWNYTLKICSAIKAMAEYHGILSFLSDCLRYFHIIT